MVIEIDQSIKKGEELFSQGNIKEAEILFLNLLRTAPDHPDILNNLGTLCYILGELEASEKYFSHAIKADPNHIDSILNLSLLYQGAQRWKEASEQLERILENNKDNIEIINQLALVYLEAGNYAQAITTLKRSLSLNPGQPDIINALNRLQSCQISRSDGKGFKVLHVMVVDKFMPSFIDFIDKHFGRANHQFVFIDQEKYEYGLIPEHNVEFLNTTDGIYITLLEYMKKADKIILHGLWSHEVQILLYFNQDLLKKCYWTMWGGDYYFPEKHSSIKKEIIKNMGHVINTTIGDYELVKKWYGTKAVRHKCFGYISNTYRDYSYLKKENEKDDGKKLILIGNSANPTNNHSRILDKIKAFKNDNIELICPLSYGDRDYAQKVIHLGDAIFGSKFKPLTEFIPFEEYMKILLKIDLAVFAHNRQQGLGNIRALLGMGKKVYMRDDITSWRSLKELNLKVYSFNNENIDFDFPEHIQKENIKKMKENFSYDRLISDWTEIFNDCP